MFFHSYFTLRIKVWYVKLLFPVDEDLPFSLYAQRVVGTVDYSECGDELPSAVTTVDFCLVGVIGDSKERFGIYFSGYGLLDHLHRDSYSGFMVGQRISIEERGVEEISDPKELARFGYVEAHYGDEYTGSRTFLKNTDLRAVTVVRPAQGVPGGTLREAQT